MQSKSHNPEGPKPEVKVPFAPRALTPACIKALYFLSSTLTELGLMSVSGGVLGGGPAYLVHHGPHSDDYFKCSAGVA